MDFEPPQLHELIIDYKMVLDSILYKSDTDMIKIFNIVNLNLDYAEMLKSSNDITLNDLKVWQALSYRALINL